MSLIFDQEAEVDGGKLTSENSGGQMSLFFLLQVDHPKEDERCPDPSMVIDIWGYCR